MRKIKLFTRYLRVLLVIASLIMPLTVQAQSSDNDASSAAEESTRIFLPMISAEGNNQVDNTVDAKALIKALNEKYKGTGISFFEFDQIEGDTLRAANATEQPYMIESNNVVKVADKEELMALIDSMYLLTKGNESGVQLLTPLAEESVQAADITRYVRATWYQPVCGGGAYYLGGVFCWKNIEAVLTAYNSGYVYNTSVYNSYLTGINILTWQHSGGNGYRLYSNGAYSSIFRLNAWGRYTMGIQAYGLTLGATWNDTWSVDIQSPCCVY